MLKIATYNVLADAYAKPEYYPHFAEQWLAADVRYPRVVERVVGLDADVLCLQEVDHRLFRMLVERLTPLGYRGRWAHKDGSKIDGVATFARVRWRWSEARIVTLDHGVAGHVALLIRLVSPGRHLLVANAHLRWDAPERRGADHAGCVQAEVLRAALDAEHGCAVVCGDFNAVPFSELVCAFLDDAWMDPHPVDSSTCFANGAASKIDYVLARGRMSAALRIDPHPVPPISFTAPVPSLAEPSDHVPVTATIRF